MKTIENLLTKLRACKSGQEWAQGKTFFEVYTTCERGEWLCWLFAKTNPEDVQLLTLVKGHQANTVRHLMIDERSREAVDTAIAFGEGRATKEELRNAEDAAYAAYAAAGASNAAAAASAAYATTKGAADAAYAAYAASGASYAAAAASASARAYSSYAAEAADDAAVEAAEQANQKLTADIFRKYISIEKFNI